MAKQSHLTHHPNNYACFHQEYYEQGNGIYVKVSEERITGKWNANVTKQVDNEKQQLTISLPVCTTVPVSSWSK